MLPKKGFLFASLLAYPVLWLLILIIDSFTRTFKSIIFLLRWFVGPSSKSMFAVIDPTRWRLGPKSYCWKHSSVNRCTSGLKCLSHFKISPLTGAIRQNLKKVEFIVTQTIAVNQNIRCQSYYSAIGSALLNNLSSYKNESKNQHSSRSSSLKHLRILGFWKPNTEFQHQLPHKTINKSDWELTFIINFVQIRRNAGVSTMTRCPHIILLLAKIKRVR